MDTSNRTNGFKRAELCDVDCRDLHAVEGGFGGGFIMGWGGGTVGNYDGTSWETDIDGTCYIDGRYY